MIWTQAFNRLLIHTQRTGGSVLQRAMETCLSGKEKKKKKKEKKPTSLFRTQLQAFFTCCPIT